MALALALAPDRDCRPRYDYNKIIFNSVSLCGSLCVITSYSIHYTKLYESVHNVSGEQIDDYLRSADIGLLYFKPSPYMDMAMPYKLFDYAAHGLPILCSAGTAVAWYCSPKGPQRPGPTSPRARQAPPKIV